MGSRNKIGEHQVNKYIYIYLSSLKAVNMLKSNIYIILVILTVSLFEETCAKGGMGKNSGRLAAGRGGRGGASGGLYGGGDYENAPCVGLCYHNKLQALEEKSDDYSRGWSLNRKEFDKQPPCTGLCQMFRELNLPNPFDGRFQHTGTRPTPKPTTQSTSRPS